MRKEEGVGSGEREEKVVRRDIPGKSNDGERREYQKINSFNKDCVHPLLLHDQS